MKYRKVLILFLLLLMLVQYVYFGIEHCDQCDFDGMAMKEFFNQYEEKCLVQNEINFSELTFKTNNIKGGE